MLNDPHEPTADARLMARTLRDTYIAMRHEGFTEREAIGIIGEVIRAVMESGPPDESG